MPNLYGELPALHPTTADVALRKFPDVKVNKRSSVMPSMLVNKVDSSEPLSKTKQKVHKKMSF